MKIIIFAEQREGKLKHATYEAITAGMKLAGNAENLSAVLIGDNLSSATAALQEYGLGEIITVAAANLYNPLTYTDCLQETISACSPQLLLGIASPMGCDLLARLAARLDCGIITDAVQVENKDGNIHAIKPMYAGKCLAEVKMHSAPFGIVALRPNVFPPAAKGDSQTKTRQIEAKTPPNKLVTREIRKGNSEKADLTEATTIISGGRAMANADNFKILHECAEVIDATVGASRAAVDSGYAPHDMQVGQTGKTVNPNLYIACGISGSVQHMAGMRTSKVIVAVNTDEEAPIFSIANYGIVADLFEAVPILTKEFKQLLDE